MKNIEVAINKMHHITEEELFAESNDDLLHYVAKFIGFHCAVCPVHTDKVLWVSSSGVSMTCPKDVLCNKAARMWMKQEEEQEAEDAEAFN